MVENCPPTVELSCKEAFGPICTLAPFSDFKEALQTANRSDFGLQCGIFTKDIHKAFYAYKHLDVVRRERRGNSG